MTNEDPELVRKTAAAWNVAYPIAIVRGRDVDAAYGIRGFPTAVLVERDGSVAWAGHPAALSAGRVREVLEGGGT